MQLRKFLFLSYFTLAASQVFANEEPSALPPVVVRVQSEDILGEATSGSEGILSRQRLQAVPILRPGETLEMVPGLIVTQHAGDGKANQYFLRGFNLDHGTDFATYINGIPVNMPSHAHGQGYTDLNFLIPELVDSIRYRKGPYFAEEGDFSSAGVARIDYQRKLERNLAQFTGGSSGFARSLLAGSPALGSGHLLYGLEWFHNDGPWDVPENYRKLNGLLRYSEGSSQDGFSLSAMAYRGQWTSTDQVAQRTLETGQLGRFGSLDPSTGGITQRYSLSGDWATRGENHASKANAWWLKSGLDLWSNFQYCLNDFNSSGSCATGDQFKQTERRQAAGFAFSQSHFGQWQGREMENALGLQGRFDHLHPVALYRSGNRVPLSTVRSDELKQHNLALWIQNEIRWQPWLRSSMGLRADHYTFQVDSNLAANSGQSHDQMLTPKLSLILQPGQKSEIYLNYGHGFHSNDARGATIQVDPADGKTPLPRVQPLVRTKGQELGARSELIPGWHTTFSLWQLDAASELLFVGDAGTTEASRPSRRRGIEWSNLYSPHDGLAIDADFSWSHARFRDQDPAGTHIPGAITRTANLGLTIDHRGPWSMALRLRYFGPRPLIEDNSVRSPSSTLLNGRATYQLDRQTRLSLEVYNLLNRRLNDIEYWYESQLANENAAVFDRHVHPTEPRSLRLTITHRF